LPNGITFACPTGDPGCVTPIGYKTYDAAFSPGPIDYVNSFGAQDSTTQIGLGTKIAPIERYYFSVGYIIRGSNYLGYPSEGGMGFGLDKLPDVDRALSFYGNFWLFFNVKRFVHRAEHAVVGRPFRISAAGRVPHVQLPVRRDVHHSEDAGLRGSFRRRRPGGRDRERSVRGQAQRAPHGRRVEVLDPYFPGAQIRELADTGA
jgi:hypothetical protein